MHITIMYVIIKQKIQETNTATNNVHNQVKKLQRQMRMLHYKASKIKYGKISKTY